MTLESAARQQCSRHRTLSPRGVSSRAAHSAHSSVTGPAAVDGKRLVDFVFILGLIVLYAVTHWLIGAISRLGGIE
jgi:hypothetical protein